MTPEGKLAQGRVGRGLVNDEHFRRDDQGRDARFINRAVVMPRTGGALLIVAGTIVMMDRGKNSAHAHVEQAQNCCNGSFHSDDVRNVKPKNASKQAYFRP
jgi:hypothetical protein